MVNAASDFDADRDDGLDEINRQIPAAVQHRGRAFLTGTQLAGAEALRACLLNPATSEDDVVLLLDEIRAAAITRAAEIRR